MVWLFRSFEKRILGFPMALDAVEQVAEGNDEARHEVDAAEHLVLAKDSQLIGS
jgi:hypothetical protein